MFAEQRPLADGAGVQRDELFSLAEQLSEELGRMGGQLRAIVAQVRARRTASSQWVTCGWLSRRSKGFRGSRARGWSVPCTLPGRRMLSTDTNARLSRDPAVRTR